jgi:myo-inositol-1(or 4)-monophosphatase
VDPLTCAIETALEAGALLRDRIDGPLGIETKGARGDLVTLADRESETLIVSRLRGGFPSSGVLGEEGSAVAGTSDERWIIDPIDGTTNYAHGYPIYSISIAYERAGVVQCGVIYGPALGELYAAELGAGARCNDRRIVVSDVATVAQSMVCTGFQPSRFERNGHHFAALSGRAQAVRRDGSAALDLAFVASGRYEAFWEYDLKAWDFAAGALIVRESGGNVTTMTGAAFDLGASSILASNGAVHAEMIAALGATA